MAMNRRLFALLLILAASFGCNLADRQSPPNVAETPPYLQPQRELTQSRQQLAEMRTFHEKESARMSESINIAHNREMEQLAAAGKELEHEKKPEQRTKWTSWFKKTDTL